MDTIDCPKCEHEHEPSGSDEEDSAEWECENCGFAFKCEIEYEPSYITHCVTHEFGDVQTIEDGGTTYRYRRCKHCQRATYLTD